MTDQSEQERARQLVHREVMVCLSSLVSTLANGYDDGSTAPQSDLAGLCEQAFELASPIQDYEEAAIQEMGRGRLAFLPDRTRRRGFHPHHGM